MREEKISIYKEGYHDAVDYFVDYLKDSDVEVSDSLDSVLGNLALQFAEDMDIIDYEGNDAEECVKLVAAKVDESLNTDSINYDMGFVRGLNSVAGMYGQASAVADDMDEVIDWIRDSLSTHWKLIEHGLEQKEAV